VVTAPSVAPSSAPAASAHPAAVIDGTVSFGGKAEKIAKIFLNKQPTGQYIFGADAESGIGFAVQVGTEVKDGVKITKIVDVPLAHLVDNGKQKLEAGQSATLTLEVKQATFGTFESPGRCAGTFTVEVKTKKGAVKSTGTFTDVGCFQ